MTASNEFLASLPGLQAGIWRHYKGPLYEVSGYSHNSSDGNKVQVLYRGLELDAAKPGPRWSTRDVFSGVSDYGHYEGFEGFFDVVCTNSKCQSRNDERNPNGNTTTTELGRCRACDHLGTTVMRFTYLAPTFEPWMLTDQAAGMAFRRPEISLE